jgi:predicted nuclease of predicted toxin-antitoxin system
VKLLFDQNLSRRLVGELEQQFPDSVHVASVGLDTATDREIWDFAAEHDYVIVSKDSDFRQLAFLHGPPPKVVWLRVGNCSTATIAQHLQSGAEAIATFATSAEEALLVLPDLDR